MRGLGFHEKVITFLMDTFWYDSTDAVFNFCAYHEKNIIDKLRIEIDKGEYKGIVRRHDSIIYLERLQNTSWTQLLILNIWVSMVGSEIMTS